MELENNDHLMMKVLISISCRKLKNLDFLTKSDPRVEVFEHKNGDW